MSSGIVQEHIPFLIRSKHENTIEKSEQADSRGKKNIIFCTLEECSKFLEEQQNLPLPIFHFDILIILNCYTRQHRQGEASSELFLPKHRLSKRNLEILPGVLTTRREKVEADTTPNKTLSNLPSALQSTLDPSLKANYRPLRGLPPCPFPY